MPWLWLAACTQTPPEPEPEPDPEGWETLRFGRPGFGLTAPDGSTTWVVDGEGHAYDASDPEAWIDHGEPTLPLPRVQGASARDGILWVLHYEELARYDGAWSTVSLPPALFGASAIVARRDGTVAVLTGDQPTIDRSYTYHPSVTTTLGLWDGADWTVTSTGPDEWLRDLVETDDGTLVAVGGGGWVAHWDGAAWVDDHRDEDTLRVVTADGDEIVALGDDGFVVRGALGALTTGHDGVPDPSAVAVGADGAVWALSWDAAWVDDGAGFVRVEVPADNAYGDLAVLDDGSVLLVGDEAGPTARLGGVDGWDVVWRQPALWGVEDVWVDVDGTVWLAAHGAIGRWSPDGAFEAWTPPNPPNASAGDLVGVAGRGPDDVVAGGRDGLFAWDGAAWSWDYVVEDAILWDVAMAPDGTAFAGLGVFGPDESQIPQLLRRDGGVWTVDPAPIPVAARGLMALHAFAPDDVYALTWEPNTLLHHDGAAWTDLTGELGALYSDLWGRSGDDLYLVSDEDTVPSLLHWDGTAAVPVAGAPERLSGVGGTDDAVLVSGTDGWGEAYAPFTSILVDGVWTEMYRASSRMAVGGAGATAVVVGDDDVWRGPAASWGP